MVYVSRQTNFAIYKLTFIKMPLPFVIPICRYFLFFFFRLSAPHHSVIVFVSDRPQLALPPAG